MSKTTEQDVHLTTKELAKRLKKSPGHITNMRVAGTGPGFIPGRPVVYRLSEVEKWEASKVQKSTAHKRPGFTGKRRQEVDIFG